MSTGVAERYEDRGLIGMGGQAEVRRVHDRRLGRDLAMKILRSEFAEHEGLRSRFVEEAEATAQLQHPGIVPVHDLGEVSDGRPFFVMKEVSGQTFTQVITSAHECSSERWAVELRGLVNVLQQVSRALAYAHMRGVLHRDLKPDNVMVGDFGEVVVMDWGLAKVQGRADPLWGAFGPAPVVTERSRDASQYTVYGTVSGTPAYMPPEQASGSTDEVDARSDVYALGAMLYEVLVGVAPYSGESSPDILSQVVQGPPPPVRAASSRALPEELVVLCERAMSRERHLRPASVDLGHFAGPGSLLSFLPPRGRRGRKTF